MQTSLKEFEESEAEFRLLEEGEKEAYENLSPGMQLPEQLIERRISWLMSGDRKVFFLVQDRIPVGYVVLSYGRSDSAIFGRIDSIYVKKEQRGRRHAARLLKHVSTVLKSQGISALRLEVMATNDQALRAYEREGFSIIGYQMELDIDG